MKKLVILIVFSVLAGSLQAQNDAISKFFSKYADDQSFTVVNVTKRMFSLFSEIDAEDPESKEAMSAISKLDGLKVLASDDSTRTLALYKEALTLIPRKDYEELMTVRHDDQDMQFLIKDNGGKIEELVMVAGGNDGFFIVSLVGDIDLSQMSKISNSMNIDGFENFQHLDDDHNEDEDHQE